MQSPLSSSARRARGPSPRRRPRRSIVVLAGRVRAGERAARTLAATLDRSGVETIYLGRADSARRVAVAVVTERADAVDVCVASGGLRLLRQLLRELAAVGRPDVTITLRRTL